MPKPNQPIGTQANALPAKKQHQQIAAAHQHQHGKGKKTQIAKKAREAGIILHVIQSIDMNESRDGSHQRHHHNGEGIKQQAPLNGDIPRHNPRHDDNDAWLSIKKSQSRQSTHRRHNESDGHAPRRPPSPLGKSQQGGGTQASHQRQHDGTDKQELHRCHCCRSWE